MPPLDLQTSAQSSASTEAQNAVQLTQVMGSLIDNMGTQSGDVVAAINDVTQAVTDSLIGGTTGVTTDQVLVAKGTSGFALQPTVVTIDPATGDITTPGTLAVTDITAETVTADDGVFANSLTIGGEDVAITTQTVCCSWTFKYPDDETVALILNAKFAWTITETNTITEVGTSTVTVDINSTPLGGASNSASTSLNTQTQSSANVVALTNQINVTFASTSSDCENLCLTIYGTRVLA